VKLGFYGIMVNAIAHGTIEAGWIDAEQFLVDYGVNCLCGWRTHLTLVNVVEFHEDEKTHVQKYIPMN